MKEEAQGEREIQMEKKTQMKEGKDNTRKEIRGRRKLSEPRGGGGTSKLFQNI